MKKYEKKQLDFLLTLPKEELAHHVGNIYPSVQMELFQNFPETFKILSDRVNIITPVVRKMLASHKKIWLDVLKKQPFSYEDEAAMIKLWPEITKEIQDSRIENDCLLPEAEKAYYNLCKKNPKLPRIKYIWHPAFNEQEEKEETIEQMIQDLDLLS